MDTRGFTRVEAILVIVIAIVVIGADGAAFWFLNQKTHDLQTLSDVQQIRSGLEAFATNSTHYPKSTDIIPLNDSFSDTEKLCAEGFVRFSKECDKVILPFVPNTYAADGEQFMYRTVNDGQDYQLQFEILSNFIEVEIPKGVHCATSTGIVNQSCF